MNRDIKIKLSAMFLKLHEQQNNSLIMVNNS